MQTIPRRAFLKTSGLLGLGAALETVAGRAPAFG